MKTIIDNYFLCLDCKQVSYTGRDQTLNVPLPRTLTCECCGSHEEIGKFNDSLGTFEKECFTKFVEFELLEDIITDEEDKGRNGEKRFSEWLDLQKLPYLFIEQSKDTFAQIFNSSVKRPDFLISFESGNSVFIDVKNRKPYHYKKERYLTVDTTKKGSRYIELEGTFKLNVWFVYLDPEKENTWLWISAKDAINKGDELKDKNLKSYLSINQKYFVSVKDKRAMEALLKKDKKH